MGILERIGKRRRCEDAQEEIQEGMQQQIQEEVCGTTFEEKSSLLG